jgi:hypothetical protein
VLREASNVLRWGFNMLSETFNRLRSGFKVLRSRFNMLRLGFNMLRSQFNMLREMLNALPLVPHFSTPQNSRFLWGKARYHLLASNHGRDARATQDGPFSASFLLAGATTCFQVVVRLSPASDDKSRFGVPHAFHDLRTSRGTHCRRFSTFSVRRPNFICGRGFGRVVGDRCASNSVDLVRMMGRSRAIAHRA